MLGGLLPRSGGNVQPPSRSGFGEFCVVDNCWPDSDLFITKRMRGDKKNHGPNELWRRADLHNFPLDKRPKSAIIAS